MPHCCAIGCTTDHAVEKVLSGKDPEDLYWVVHVKIFYEIYKCYVANKKNLCQCRYNGKRKIFQCSYCGSIAAFEFAYERFYDNNKTKYSVIEKVKVQMIPHRNIGFLVAADIFSRKFIEKREHLRVLYI